MGHRDRSSDDYLRSLLRSVKSNGREYIPGKTQLAYGADGTCSYCQIPLTPYRDNHPTSRTVDHHRPLRHQGSNHPSNLRACCSLCNTVRNKIDLALTDPPYRLNAPAPHQPQSKAQILEAYLKTLRGHGRSLTEDFTEWVMPSTSDG